MKIPALSSLRATLAIVVVLLHAVALGAAAAASAPVSEARQRASRLHEKTLLTFAVDFDRAAARTGFLASAEADPTYVPPRLNLAMLAAAGYQWAEAIKWETEVEKLSDAAGAAEAAVRIKQLEAYQTQWATPEGRKKLQYDLTISRARILLKNDKFEEAKKEGELALKVDKTRVEAWVLLGHLAVLKDDLPAATSALTEARKVAPAAAAADIEIAMKEVQTMQAFASAIDQANDFYSSKSYGEAAAQFQHAFTLRPERGDVGLMAASTFVLAGKPAAAIEVLEGVIKTGDMAQRVEATKLLMSIRDQTSIKDTQKQKTETVETTYETQGRFAEITKKEEEAKARIEVPLAQKQQADRIATIRAISKVDLSDSLLDASPARAKYPVLYSAEYKSRKLIPPLGLTEMQPSEVLLGFRWRMGGKTPVIPGELEFASMRMAPGSTLDEAIANRNSVNFGSSMYRDKVIRASSELGRLTLGWVVWVLISDWVHSYDGTDTPTKRTGNVVYGAASLNEGMALAFQRSKKEYDQKFPGSTYRYFYIQAGISAKPDYAQFREAKTLVGDWGTLSVVCAIEFVLPENASDAEEYSLIPEHPDTPEEFVQYVRSMPMKVYKSRTSTDRSISYGLSAMSNMPDKYLPEPIFEVR